MSIKDNFPALKPSLSLDFANTKTLDPRITFSRASTGTYYDGVTHAKAEENLLLNSQDYSSEWTVTDLTATTGVTAPDGTSTATEFAASSANGVLTQGYTAVAGDYTFSVWLRRVTGTGDIQIAADNGTWTTETITGTWARYDVTQTVAAGSKTAGVRVVTSGDEIEVWGAQLEQRSSVTAYTATTTQPITNYIPVLQSAAAGEARFDHDPVTGESKGLLIEEQRTNLFQISESFDAGYWNKVTATITAGQIIAPSGELTADLKTNGIISRAHSTGTFTVSIYAKAYDASSTIKLQPNGAGPAGVESTYDFSTGDWTPGSTTYGSGYTFLGRTFEDVGNGWVRVSLSFTAASSGNIWFTGSQTYIWGAQLEAGAFPTSYIATSGSQATRSADSASMTGTNFSEWYRQDEGSFCAEASPTVTNINLGVLSADDGSNNNRIQVFSEVSGDVRAQMVTSGNVQAAMDTGTTTAGVFFKSAAAFDTNDSAHSVNGGAAETDTSCLIPAVDRLRIGSLVNTNYLNGTIKKIAYYPARLTNAQLQALTEG